MTNMRHCRFTNTLVDLHDCLEAMDDQLSQKEGQSRKSLIKLCCSIAKEYGGMMLECDAEEDQLEIIKQRDNYHEWADKLAETISKAFNQEIGEHTSANNPWAKAIEIAESFEPPKSPRCQQCLEED
jgi:hypothetical protein